MPARPKGSRKGSCFSSHPFPGPHLGPCGLSSALCSSGSRSSGSSPGLQRRDGSWGLSEACAQACWDTTGGFRNQDKKPHCPQSLAASLWLGSPFSSPLPVPGATTAWSPGLGIGGTVMCFGLEGPLVPGLLDEQRPVQTEGVVRGQRVPRCEEGGH